MTTVGSTMINDAFLNAWQENDITVADAINYSDSRIMQLVDEKIKQLQEEKDVIVKCSHCGQWSARKTECRKCGAPVD
jgi:methionyl-tRNA synthetase